MKFIKLKNSINTFILISLFSGPILPSIANLLVDENKRTKQQIDLEKKIYENIPRNYLDNIPKNDYIVGPGDILRISVSRNIPELFSKSGVDGEGTIYLPRIQRVYVAGLSIKELNILLKEKFQKFVKDPNPEVEIEKYRTIKISVNGEVMNPGLQTLGGSINLPIPTDLPKGAEQLSVLSQLENNDMNNRAIGDNNGININQFFEPSYNQNPLIPKLNIEEYKNRLTSNVYFPTVIDAIRSSGGFTEFSDLEQIELIRINNLSQGGGKIKTILDFSSLLADFSSDQNIRIYDGDIISVKRNKQSNQNILNRSVQAKINSKFINVFVAGRVNTPGIKKLFRGSTVNDAILVAGGPKIIKGPVRLLSFKNNGSIDKRKFKFSLRNKRGGFKNPYLQDGDLIAIGNSPLSITSEIIKEITSPLTGIFSTYGLIKALSD